VANVASVFLSMRLRLSIVLVMAQVGDGIVLATVAAQSFVSVSAIASSFQADLPTFYHIGGPSI